VGPVSTDGVVGLGVAEDALPFLGRVDRHRQPPHDLSRPGRNEGDDLAHARGNGVDEGVDDLGRN
jgi:hypothetical protein